MKRILCLVLVLVMTFALVACGSKPATASAPAAEAPATAENTEEVAEVATKPIKIGYYGSATTEKFFKDIYDGLEAACKDRGWELLADFTAYDPVKMRAAYDNFKAQGVDFIVDGNALVEVIQPFAEEAAKDGIPYLALHVSLPEPAYTFGSKDVEMGEANGKYIGQMIVDEWDSHVDVVVSYNCYTKSPALVPRTESSYDVLCDMMDCTNTEYIEVDAYSSETQKAYQNTMDILTSHPNAKIACFVVSDDIANAVYSAALAAGRNDDVMIAGSDCIDVAVQIFKDAAQNNPKCAWRGSIYLGPINYGPILCDIMEDVLNGEDIPYDNYVEPKVCGIDNVYEFFPE